MCSSVGLFCDVPAVVFMNIFHLDIFGRRISDVTQKSFLIEFVIFYHATFVEGIIPILF